MGFQELDNYFRSQEKLHTKILDNDKYYVIRIDGRGFSKFTEKYFLKPFDERFTILMNKTIQRLITEFECNIIFSYLQSDEVSFLISNKTNNLKARKLLSHIPSAFSSILNQELSGLKEVVIFDSRLIELYTKEEVLDYFKWRYLDCRRNSLNTFVFWSLVNQGKTRRQAARALETMNNEAKLAFKDKSKKRYADLNKSVQNGLFSMFKPIFKEGYNPITKEYILASRRIWIDSQFDDFNELKNALLSLL